MMTSQMNVHHVAYTIARVCRVALFLRCNKTMTEFVRKAVIVLPAIIGLYVARRVVRKLCEDFRDR